MGKNKNYGKIFRRVKDEIGMLRKCGTGHSRYFLSYVCPCLNQERCMDLLISRRNILSANKWKINAYWLHWLSISCNFLKPKKKTKVTNEWQKSDNKIEESRNVSRKVRHFWSKISSIAISVMSLGKISLVYLLYIYQRINQTDFSLVFFFRSIKKGMKNFIDVKILCTFAAREPAKPPF